jgi:alkylglycerol monooxygenase
MKLSPSQVIVLATPVFFLLIAVEVAYGRWRGRNTYRLNDAINSISLGMLSQISAVLTRLFRVGIYTAVFSWVSFWHNDAFWTSPVGWLLALVFYDFCYYWLHRAGHEVAVFWAAHVVHHQSQDYNLSTALRQTSSGALLGWIFYLPMAIAGVPPLVFGVVALVDLLYQYWVHTEHVGKLGWFDRWFCSPSNHRVHHAVNDGYLDRNYGGILVVWDRMFGSFKEEGEKCVYGTRAPLASWDPLWANFEVYWALAKDSWHARSWADKLRVWFKPPGWRPADVAERFPKPAFSLERMERYHPPMSKAMAWFACVQFAVILGGVAVFLWHADRLAVSQSAVWLAALAAALWAVGAAMQGRIGMTEVLLIEAAALATASAAQGWTELHRLFKPLAMLLAIVFVASRPGWLRTQRAFDLKLLAALVLCLAGDVFLMFPGYFIPGLVSFLVAHLCYLALFAQGVRWFPSGRVLLATLTVAGLMYAFLFPHLQPVLKVAVAAYALVIALMAAQAIGRALVLRDAAAVGVAVGAGFFMLSDAVLAINRFAQPLPMAAFWVLATYYVAQVLIVRNARPASAVGWGDARNPSAAPDAGVRSAHHQPTG